jgi:hypothetical protein
MTNIEELKKKQPEYKESLQEVIDFINSEKYFDLTQREKNLVNQYRIGLEMSINALSNLVFGDPLAFDTGISMMLPLLMSSMTNSWTPPTKAEEFKKELEEDDTHQELTDHVV